VDRDPENWEPEEASPGQWWTWVVFVSFSVYFWHACPC